MSHQLDWHDVETGEGLPPEQEPTPAPRSVPESAQDPQPTPHGDAAAQAERARVLRHPHIAARLTQPPLNYSRPEVWSGYVPPDTWGGRANDSPQRAALLAIITDAVEADKEAGR